MKALGHYDGNEFDEALKEFDVISDTSKILFNCGVIHATLGEHEKAVGFRSTLVESVVANSCLGGMLPACSEARPVSSCCVLPTGCVQFFGGRL